MDPSVQVLDPTIEVCLVVLPSHPINLGRRISLESKECGPKHRNTEMVEKRGEPLFLLCLATCRTRSSAWATLSRSCARRVLCWLAFPSAPALGSTSSAASRLTLFVGFTATMARSDFSRPYIGLAHGVDPTRLLLFDSGNPS